MYLLPLSLLLRGHLLRPPPPPPLQDKDHMGECPQCHFVFCGNCTLAWHSPW